MKKLLMALLCLVPISLFGQSPELQLVEAHDPTALKFNPDSVMIDVNSTSSTYRELYVKNNVHFTFEVDAIVAPYTTVGSVRVTWGNIESTLASIRNSFQHMDTTLGSFTLVKLDPSDTVSGSIGNRTYCLDFDSPTHLSSIYKCLTTASVTNVFCSTTFGESNGLSNDVFTVPGNSLPSMGTSTGTESHRERGNSLYANPDHMRLGWSSHIYDSKLPMAWEITKGDGRNIATLELNIAAQSKSYSDHSDLKPNYHEINGYDDYSVYYSGQYVSNVPDGHAARVSYHFGGLGENSVGSLGSAYESKFTVLDPKYPVAYADADGVSGQHLLFDVACYPFGTGGIYYVSKGDASDINNPMSAFAITNGIVAVGAIPNGFYSSIGTSEVTGQEYNTLSRFSGEQKLEEEIVLRTETPHVYSNYSPAGDDYLMNGGNSEYEYVKVLAVGRLQYSDNGELVLPGLQPGSRKNTKFAIDQNGLPDLQARREAFIDVMVPFSDVVAPKEGSASDYLIYYGNNSQASGFATGIATLVRDVISDDRYTSSAELFNFQKDVYNCLTFTAQKFNDIDPNTVQNDVSKIQEEWVADETIGGVKMWRVINYKIPNYSELFFDYSVQNHDYLKRSFAQRFGFGVVNAFRSVAQAIEAKAPHTIESKDDVVFSTGQSIDGIKFTHFGSIIEFVEGQLGEDDDFGIPFEDRGRGLGANEVVSVLEYGGVDLPGSDGLPLSSAIHNNQGVTIIGDQVILDVDKNSCAVIDGIFKTDENIYQARIRSKGVTNLDDSPGKILVTGFMQNVDLEGWIKFDDLRYFASSSAAPEITIKYHNSNAVETDSEVYGHLKMEEGTKLTIEDAATLRVKPGAQVSLTDRDQLVIKNGGTLILEYPCIIEGGSIKVEAGGELIVKSKPNNKRIWRTEVLSDVFIEGKLGKPSGTVDGLITIEDYAFVSFESFRVDGEMSIGRGAHLELLSSKQQLEQDRWQYEIDGIFNISGMGGSDNRTVISGKLNRLPIVRGHGDVLPQRIPQNS